MARDLKIANWTWPAVAAATANRMPTAQVTPTGDPTNSAATITLASGAAGTTTKEVSDAKNIGGFRNTKMDVSSFSNFIAGNEVTATTGDPAVWGSTSYGEMYARCAVQIGAQTSGATVTWNNNGFIVLEGAYDNGAGAADSSWAPVSGSIPLTLPGAYLAAVLAASNAITTVYPHKLTIGDFVQFDAVTGLTGPTAGVVYVVQSVPSVNQFTIAAVATPTTVLTTTGTPSALIMVRKLIAGLNVNKIVYAPVVQTLRPWLRWALYYPTSSTSNVSTVTISKTALTLGRDSAISY
jgi:hypothetical protein